MINKEMFNIIDDVVQDRCKVMNNPKPETWIILYNNERLILESGKSVWTKEVYAKNAFTSLIKKLAISTYYDKYKSLKLSWNKDIAPIYQAEIEDMIKNGVVKFIQLK
jgi:hypothetical protein